MGCGQSKIHLYPRKSKSKANGKKGGHADSDAETDEDEGHLEDTEKYQNRESEKHDETDEPSNKDTAETDEDVSVSLLRAKNLSLLQSQEISTSQQNFFRMLDKKIEEGPDYDSASETEIALEEARLNALVQHWESASLTASICSSASRSLQTTPVRQAAAAAAPPLKQVTQTPRGVVMQTALTLSQQQQQQQQAALHADFLPHPGGHPPPPPSQSVQQHQLPVGILKHPQQGQQLVISHLNTKMLHQMAIGQQIAMPMSVQLSMGPDTSAAASNLNTSDANTALTLLQSATAAAAPSTQAQQFPHMLNLPSNAADGSSQPLLGKPNVSPKRMVDGRLLMNPNPITQQQMQQQQQQATQFIATSALHATPSGFLNGGGGAGSGGGRSPQPGMHTGMAPGMQMAYYGQLPPIAQQQNTQAIALQHEQQLQQQQQQLQQQQQQHQPQVYYGDAIHSVAAPTEYRFPPAISVQRLAPQVQRQLRETQELIKDSCPQLYAAGYGSPGPPIRNQTRNPTRRPTLETQFSQELS